MWHHRLALALFLPSFVFLPMKGAQAQHAEPDSTVTLVETSECVRSTSYPDHGSYDSGLFIQDPGTTRSISRQIFDILYSLITPENHRFTVSCRIPEDYETLHMQFGVSDGAEKNFPLMNVLIYQSGSIRHQYLDLVSGDTRNVMIDLQDYDYGSNPNHVALELYCKDVRQNHECVLHVIKATLLGGRQRVSSSDDVRAQPGSAESTDRTNPSSDGDTVFEVIEDVFDLIF